MEQFKILPSFLLLALAAVAMPVAAAETTRPQAVSPGSPGVAAEPSATSCPTFSWTSVEAANGYELALYRLAADGVLQPQVEVDLPAGASSWTPAAAQCPEAAAGVEGNQYAWAVRVLTDDGPGAWSELLLFATPGAPTEDEVRRALKVLRRYEAVASRVPRLPSHTPAGAGSARRGSSAASPPDADSSGTGPSGTGARRYLSDPAAIATPTVGATTPSPQAVTPPASFSLNLDGDLDLGGFVFKNGESFIHDLGGNTAVGASALTNVQPNFFNQTGLRNTALGTLALVANTSGNANTAVGRRALYSSSLGNDNTALGHKALYSSSTAGDSTAVGSLALQSSTGFGNTAVGSEALGSNGAACCNTAVGHLALQVTTGHHNTAIGWSAGKNWTTGADNIAIGSGAYGVAGETDTIRIGGNGLQNKTFIEGIFGITPASASVEVFIDGNGQLGAPVSSARFKEQIHDLEGVSDRLLDLRPVSFHYKGDSDDRADSGERPIEYGLVAEEVAEVFPDLVINDAEGKPFTVRYHLLTPLLLAEVQRLEGEVSRQREQIERLRTIEEQLAALRRQVDRQTRKTGRRERER